MLAVSAIEAKELRKGAKRSAKRSGDITHPPTRPAAGESGPHPFSWYSLREHTARLSLASVSTRSVARFARMHAVRSAARFSLRSRAPGDSRSNLLARGLGGPTHPHRGQKLPKGPRNAQEHPSPASPACCRFSCVSDLLARGVGGPTYHHRSLNVSKWSVKRPGNIYHPPTWPAAGSSDARCASTKETPGGHLSPADPACGR